MSPPQSNIENRNAPPKALLSVGDALATVLCDAAPLESERVALSAALARTLSGAVVATTDQPPFDASAMDGYAVAALSCTAPPFTLKVIGESRAGEAFSQDVGQGEAVRIFTGAPLPGGTDSIVIQENVTRSGEALTVATPVNVGDHVRPRGQDFLTRDTLIASGTRFTSRDILLAAAAGHGQLDVIRRPAIAVLATGDELTEPGQPLKPGAVYSSNSYGLGAMIDGAGGLATLLATAGDTIASLTAALSGADTCDVLVTIGGASVGDHDLVRPALEQSGWSLSFHKIAMRPGKPVFFGTRQHKGRTQRCLGLPGNPVSAMITARVFLVPLIETLLGRPNAKSPLRTESAVLSTAIAANGPRDHFMRAIVDRTASPPLVTPFASQDSSLMRTLAAANALIIQPANAASQSAGEKIEFLALDF